MEDVGKLCICPLHRPILRLFGIFCGHLVYFVAIWYILWPFGIPTLCTFGIFFPFWYVGPRKIWQP
jgi:hypothetical protein